MRLLGLHLHRVTLHNYIYFIIIIIINNLAFARIFFRIAKKKVRIESLHIAILTF